MNDSEVLRAVEAWVVRAIKEKRYPFTGQMIAMELGLEWADVMRALATLEAEDKIQRML